MRLKFVLGAVLVLVLHEATSQGQFEPSNTDNLDVVANSVTNLAQKISRAIASQKSKTEIFSPVSIAGALSLLLLGSSGVTRDELTKLMGFDNQQISFADIHKSFGKLFGELVSSEPSLNTPVPWRQNDKCNTYDYEDDEPSPHPKNQRGKRDTSSHQISVANGVFVDRNFLLGARYEQLTRCLYQGKAQRLPFSTDPRSTAQQINSWARESTNGKIREIVTPEQVQNSPMVLASALYFKGKWETMFVEPDTRPRPFYVNGRNQPPVNVTAMATSGCFPYIDVKDWDAKIVGLPYQQGLSTMYLGSFNNQNNFQQLAPPPAPQVPAPPSYDQNLPPQAIVSCFEQQECFYLQGCRIIRKCYQNTNKVAQPLMNLSGRNRSKRQTNQRPLFVGDIVHKVSLDIDESGTEGGAVTAVVIDRISSSFTLRLDGPFLIYLRHDATKLPLFYGPVYDPRD
ncbi:hypothetical protein quinque_009251 [Culex quinquefasciatus]